MNEINEQTVENVTDNATDYIETINKLKQNSVSKEEFLKLKNENKQLLDALASNQTIEVAAETKRDINEVRNELFNNHRNLSNRQICQDMMDLYDYELQNRGVNIFMPTDPQYIPTQDDISQVDNMVKGMKNALDIANGNDLIFNQEIERLTK